MRVQVRFVLNRSTGQVEVFRVDAAPERAADQGDDEEHDWRHEQVAHRIASALDRSPDVSEIVPGVGADAGGLLVLRPRGEQEDEERRERETRSDEA